MWQIIKKAAVLCLILTFFLSGFPSSALFERVGDIFAEKNIVDSLYWALKDPNVVDKGLSELFKPHVEKAHAATFSIQTGYYVGNATDNRAITGLGFSPDLVILKDNTAAGTAGVIFKTSSMSGELTLVLAETDANLSTNYIQSLDGDGFTIGTATDVNSSNIMHYYAAFDGSDCSSSGTFCVGSYTGNGSSQGITSVGFQPDLVVVKRSAASSVGGVWRSSAMSGTNSNYFSATAQLASGGIEALTSTGFTVGSNADVNASSATYYFFAFKEVSGFMDVGTYTGNATDNRAINSSVDAGLTFEPNFVWTKHSSGATVAVASITQHYGDRSVLFTDSASAANNIQELRSAGGFEVGTAANVNSSAVVYYYAAFGGAVARSAGSGSFNMTNGSYTGTGTGFSVTGLGFAPDLVIIKHNDQATDQYAVFKTRLMIGDRTAYLANAVTVFTGGITALGSDGFTVGAGATVNTSGDTYYWTAYGNAMMPDVSGGSSDFLIGQYIGTGRDNVNVRALPIQPDLVAVKRVSTTAGAWRTSNQSGDLSLYFHALAQAANIIQGFNSDGFQIGTAANTNTSGNTYDYFMFKTGSRFAVNTYTGNGSSQNVTSAGFQPDHLWAKKITGGTARGGILRTSAQTGDASQPFLNLPSLTGGITALFSNGFSVGSAVETNENTFVYQYAAWDGKRYAQQAYRFFANADSTDVGSALATQDNPATLSSTGDAFRLRMLLRVDNGNLFSSGQNFKLQFAEQSGTCDTGFSGESYADVTGATVIAYNNNSSADGDDLTPNVNDPTDGGRAIVNQDYEEANNFTNSVAAINTGQDGKWDFSLIDNGATANTSYCFRVLKSDGTQLDTYSVVPQITTAAGSPVYSVSITSSGVIEYGFVELSTASSTVGNGYTQTAQNDGNTTEKLNVKSSNATGGTTWTLASSIGTNIFKHEFSTTTGLRWDVMPDSATYVTAAPSVVVSGTVSFDFRLTTPSASTDYQQKSITITVQAVAP